MSMLAVPIAPDSPSPTPGAPAAAAPSLEANVSLTRREQLPPSHAAADGSGPGCAGRPRVPGGARERVVSVLFTPLKQGLLRGRADGRSVSVSLKPINLSRTANLDPVEVRLHVVPVDTPSKTVRLTRDEAVSDAAGPTAVTAESAGDGAADEAVTMRVVDVDDAEERVALGLQTTGWRGNGRVQANLDINRIEKPRKQRVTVDLTHAPRTEVGMQVVAVEAPLEERVALELKTTGWRGGGRVQAALKVLDVTPAAQERVSLDLAHKSLNVGLGVETEQRAQKVLLEVGTAAAGAKRTRPDLRQGPHLTRCTELREHEEVPSERVKLELFVKEPKKEKKKKSHVIDLAGNTVPGSSALVIRRKNVVMENATLTFAEDDGGVVIEAEGVILRNLTIKCHTAVPLTVTAPDVTVINCKIMAEPDGASFAVISKGRGSRLQLENCDVTGGLHACLLAIEGSTLATENCTVTANLGTAAAARAVGTYSGLELANSTLSSEGGSAVVLSDAAEGGLENVTISGAAAHGVQVGSGCGAELAGCHIYGTMGCCVEARKHSRVGLEECDLQDAQGAAGLRAAGKGLKVTATRTLVRGAASRGVLSTKKATVVLRECEITETRAGVGCAVEGGSALSMEGCRVHENNGDGVLVTTGSDLKMEDCEVHGQVGQTAFGLLVQDMDSLAELVRCTLRDEPASVVQVQQGADLKMTDCTVSGGLAYHGIVAQGQDTDMVLTNCTITQNHCSAVFVLNGATADLSKCAISHSHRFHGLELTGADSSATLTQCEIADNRQSGAMIYGAADATFIECTVRDSQMRHGVVVEGSNTTLELQRCKLQGSARHAIMVTGGASVAARRCKIMESGSGDGVYVTGAQSEAALKKCIAFDHSMGACLRAHESGSIVAAGCELWGNGAEYKNYEKTVPLEEGARPLVRLRMREGLVSSAHLTGVMSLRDGERMAVNNAGLRGGTKHHCAHAAGADSTVMLVKCTLVDATSIGVIAKANGEVKMEDCTTYTMAYKIAGAGIREPMEDEEPRSVPPGVQGQAVLRPGASQKSFAPTMRAFDSMAPSQRIRDIASMMPVRDAEEMEAVAEQVPDVDHSVVSRNDLSVTSRREVRSARCSHTSYKSETFAGVQLGRTGVSSDDDISDLDELSDQDLGDYGDVQVASREASRSAPHQRDVRLADVEVASRAASKSAPHQRDVRLADAADDDCEGWEAARRRRQSADARQHRKSVGFAIPGDDGDDDADDDGQSLSDGEAEISARPGALTNATRSHRATPDIIPELKFPSHMSDRSDSHGNGALG